MKGIITKISAFFPFRNLTRWAILFYLLGLLAFGAYKTFKHPSLDKFVIGSDTEGYYQYLPWFFLHDWHDFQYLPWAKPYGEGKTLSVFTCGTAILQAPFFLTAHAITRLSNLKADGYGPVYYFSVFLAGLFYAMLGLVFLIKALARMFNFSTAFIAAVLIFYGTNLFYYTIMGPGMSHVYSFFLLSLFLFTVPRFYDKPGITTALAVSLPLSLAVLIRPTNGVAVLYLLFYGIACFRETGPRLGWLIRKWPLFICMGLSAFVVFIPQLIYWHYVTGDWLVYSYQEEGFSFWKNPQFVTVLFGKRGGWFTYTPLMWFAFITLVWMAWKKIHSAPVILLTILVIIYLDASWWAPTFSASAGYRALIEFLPFMAVPVAFFYHKIRMQKNRKIQLIFNIVIWIIILYNIQFAFKYDSTVWWDWEWSYKTMLRLFTF